VENTSSVSSKYLLKKNIRGVYANASDSFQEVQLLSAMQASLRFLPSIVVGVMISFGTDAVLHRWDAYHYVTVMCSISCIAPLLMALMKPTWSYWYMSFWSMLLLPFAGDGESTLNR
jgi:hypothetical protein